MGVAASDVADQFIAAGQPLEDAGDFEAALAWYNRAIQADPGSARPHMNAGNALARLRRWDEALAAFRHAVACAPDYAPARFNLGSLVYSRGAFEEAESELLYALRLQPDMIAASIVLADLYEASNRFDEAEAQFERALRISPGHAGTMLNFGLFCVRQGRIDEALRWLQRARVGDPTFRSADSQILFSMNFRADLTARDIRDEHEKVGNLISAAAGPPISRWSNTIDPMRRLRVGYVSGDFGPHPIALFIKPILEQHDRSAFEVFCYSNGPHDDAMEPTLRRRSDHWRSITGLDDARVIDQIGSDRIDILVDLAGHTNRGRLAVFARHPAPVQVTWLGYLNTTGLRAMDYRITDAHTDPPGSTEHLHAEQLVRMPHSQWCYSPWHRIDPIRTPHPERPGALVFGSFNQYAKVTDATLELWSKVLAATAGFELVVFDVRHAKARDLLSTRLQAHGIDTTRVTFHGRVAIDDYFRAIGNVDIALDTIPYNGATTTLDALWMGVPLVALRGDRGISRGSYSILKTLGADELIAHRTGDYVDINVRLANDAHWRARLRETLRPRLAASPLMDAKQFVADLETRYRTMWRNWCAAQAGTGR